MSADLKHPNKCAKCGLLMKAGTIVDFFKDGQSYVYLHALPDDVDPLENPDPCAWAGAQAKAVAGAKRFRPRLEVRECSNFGRCHYATGVGFAGKAPARCPLCNSLWLADPADMELAA